MIGPFWRGAEPQVPVEVRRHVVPFQRALDRLRPNGSVGPVLHLAHGADRAGLNPLADLSRPLLRVALVTHLCGYSRGPGDFGHLAHLPNRAGQRLLAVDGLAQLHRHDRGHGMRVIGRGHDHRIDVGRILLEHFAEIFETLSLGESVERTLRAFPIDVAQRIDILVAHTAHVGAASAPNADARDIERITRRAVSAAAQHMPRHDRECQPGRRGVTDEFASRDLLRGHVVLLVGWFVSYQLSAVSS